MHDYVSGFGFLLNPLRLDKFIIDIFVQNSYLIAWILYLKYMHLLLC